VLGDIELICKGNAVSGCDWEDLVLTVAIEGCPFEFRILIPKVEDLFPAVVGDSELTT
jgi:hypothetical protein